MDNEKPVGPDWYAGPYLPTLDARKAKAKADAKAAKHMSANQ